MSTTVPEVTIDLSIFEQEVSEEEIPCECRCHPDGQPAAISYWFTHCTDRAMCPKCDQTIRDEAKKLDGQIVQCNICNERALCSLTTWRYMGPVK